ncbi:Peptide/nickel transport system permease protein [Hyphomicrobiales bacterium]|nr:Peptide/nickel transport system permease protein [Hyphomicrobiales bacterium]CAH1693689.1 Peptide/nickel transport system permease protein [Hyphomicrobiales bacterium]
MPDRGRIARYIILRLLQAVPTLAGIVVLNFFILKLAPGDAVDALAADMGAATAETMAAMRARFGLDQTVLHQFWVYLQNLMHLSLGISPRYDIPVSTLIGGRITATLVLMLSALIWALGLGVLCGALMAARVGRWQDRLLWFFIQILYSVPFFWVGLLLIVLFSVKLNILPSGGIGGEGTGLLALLDDLRYLILPTVTLSLFYIAVYSRLVRSAMLEVSGQDYVRTAYAKGLSQREVYWRHVLRNALMPLTTISGMHFGGILGGAVVVETVFNWPGLGRLAYDAIMGRDYNVLLGILLISSLLVLATNVLVDVIQAWLDPRIELGR